MSKKYTKYILMACSALFSLSLPNVTWADDVNTLVETCAACHGKDGTNSDAAIPNIGGYSVAYMSGALMRFKNKERPCVVMCEIVKDWSDADIKQVAEYFAGQKFVRTSQKFDPLLAMEGKKIHEKNCEMCHSEGGSVAVNDSGILAGQKVIYLEEQFKFISEGTRQVPKMMMSRFHKVVKTGYIELINYYASFK